MHPSHDHAHADGPCSVLHRRPTRRGIRRFAIATGVAAVAGFVAMPTADAQTTTIPPLQAIMVTVNLNVATPSGVTGYRFDSICKNVPGTPTGDLSLSLGFGASGGTGLVLVPLSGAVSCAFRLAVLGSGPRPLAGNSIVVGGVARLVSFPPTIDGVAVDSGTVIETDQIAVIAPTAVLIGPAPVAPTTTLAPTTLAPTTVAPTTTVIPTTVAPPPTTRPAATTVPPSATVVVDSVAPTTTTVAKAVVRTKLVSRRVCTKVRNSKCVVSKIVKVRVRA